MQGIYPLHTGVNVGRILDIWSIALSCDFSDLLLRVHIKSTYLNYKN